MVYMFQRLFNITVRAIVPSKLKHKHIDISIYLISISIWVLARLNRSAAVVISYLGLLLVCRGMSSPLLCLRRPCVDLAVLLFSFGLHTPRSSLRMSGRIGGSSLRAPLACLPACLTAWLPACLPAFRCDSPLLIRQIRATSSNFALLVYLVQLNLPPKLLSKCAHNVFKLAAWHPDAYPALERTLSPDTVSDYYIPGPLCCHIAYSRPTCGLLTDQLTTQHTA